MRSRKGAGCELFIEEAEGLSVVGRDGAGVAEWSTPRKISSA